MSLGVFAALASAGAAVMIDTLHTARDNRERVRAANVADQEIERTRAKFRVSPASVAPGSLSSTVPVEAQDYSVIREVTLLDKDGVSVSRPYSARLGDRVVVEVRVRWQGLDADRPAVINSTVLS